MAPQASRQPCRCGCDKFAQLPGKWVRGHDEMVRAAVMYLLADDTEGLAELFGFGPGLRNAEEYVARRRAERKAS